MTYHKIWHQMYKCPVKLVIIYHYKNSLMYVLSVCTALQFPAPTADTALTMTLYSVPAASLCTMVVVGGGESEMMR